MADEPRCGRCDTAAPEGGAFCLVCGNVLGTTTPETAALAHTARATVALPAQRLALPLGQVAPSGQRQRRSLADSDTARAPPGNGVFRGGNVALSGLLSSSKYILLSM